MQRLRRDRYWIEKRPLRAGVLCSIYARRPRKERALLGNDPWRRLEEEFDWAELSAAE